MTMNFTEYEGIMEELEELRELSEELPIIVEGRRDEEALRRLGIDAKFFYISSSPFYELCDAIAEEYSDVILFTDMDRAGHKLTRRLKNYLSQRSVRINEKYRLSLLSKLDTHQVENLYKRLSRVEGQFFRF
jgi:5S rRNA maturation endonuclease (ribonuclease M5)